MKYLFTAILVIVIAAFSYYIFYKPQPHEAQVSAVSVELGMPAPDFELSDVSGKTVRLSDYRGKVVLLNFWATWCPPCREEMPSMERLYEKLRARNFELLAVNVETDDKPVLAFLEDHPHSFPVLRDNRGMLQDMYNVHRFPETFIINTQGIIVDKIIGARQWDDARIVSIISDLMEN